MRGMAIVVIVSAALLCGCATKKEDWCNSKSFTSDVRDAPVVHRKPKKPRA